MLWSPMDVYHMSLGRSLMDNERLIIVGYGFPDLYINSLLNSYIDTHHDDAKTVVVDWIDFSKLADDFSEMTPFADQHEKTMFLHQMFGDQYWFERTRFDVNYVENGYWSSDKKRVLWGSGFEAVVQNKMNEIINVME